MSVRGVSLELDNLSCDYGERRVLESIDVAFSRSRFTAIVGPNGSGKSTLLKAISRVIRPAEGVVYIDGCETGSLSQRELARRMAVVPQETSHTFAFTVLDVVTMGRAPHLGRFQFERPKDLEIARQAMERTDVWKFKDRPITELSGGEKQRTIIAQALAQEPRIILLDEPTLHLDLNHQLEVMDLLKELNGEGLTVVSVLHDLNLAAYYADALVLIKEGKVVEVGSAEEVLTARMVREVFKTEALVGHHPVTGRLHITLVPKTKRAERIPVRVHLVCGSGTGASLMNELTDRGIEVTVGVVNALDTDHETAEVLGLELVGEAPFSPVSEESHRENRSLMKKADAVVVTAVPFGPANLRNLEAVLEAVDPLRVILLKAGPGRDFTGGKATSLLERLEADGARLCVHPSELVGFLEEVGRP